MGLVAVNRLWLTLLGLVLLLDFNQAIQVAPKPVKITALNTGENRTFAESHMVNGNVTVISDSELSASERNRRLIPYVAFYLPPQNYPINQQYAEQKPKQAQHQLPAQTSQHQPPPTAIDSGGPLPPPEHIPVPNAYMQPKVPNDEQIQYFQQNAGDVYHSITYGGQHPAPTNYREPGKQLPILHLLPPGPAASSAPASSGRGAAAYVLKEVKQKTVQYFPPTAASAILQQPQQRLKYQQPSYRQRPKQSKINLTPFTPSNSVPGHFIPIIYTPTSNNNGDGSNINDQNNSNNNNGNTINYNNYNGLANADERTKHEQQQQQQQQQIELQQQQQQNRQHIDNEYASLSSAPALHSQQSKEHQQSHQIQYIAVTAEPTGPALASHPTASPIYHIINEPSPTPTSSASQQQSHQQIEDESLPVTKSHQYHHKIPHFQPPEANEFFDHEERKQNYHHYQQQKQQKQPQQQQQQQQTYEEELQTQQRQPQGYLVEQDMTPQEKYVLFLQQRMRYNKQQQQLQQHQQQQAQHQQKQRERTKLRGQYVKQQPQIFIIGTTATSPIENQQTIQLSSQQQQHHHQQHNHHHHNHQSHQHSLHDAQQHNHPQHSPIGHAVYQRPQLTVPANHQPHTKSSSQILHIPMHTVVDELESLQKNNHQRQHPLQQQQYVEQQYVKGSSPSPSSKFVDYIIEEPKQSLDEETVPQQQPQSQHGDPNQAHEPGQAYIVITTAAPPIKAYRPQYEQHHGSTSRPVYKNRPTLQLKPVTTSDYREPSPTKSAKPKYVYVTNRPTYSHILRPTPTIKLKPLDKYESTTVKPSLAPIAPTKAPNIDRPTPEIHYDQAPINPYPLHPEKPIYQRPHPTVPPTLVDPNQLPDIRTSSLAEILHKLQASNHLPQTLTPDNIDNSIRTLITILNNLKQTQTIVPNPPQHHEKLPSAALAVDYDYTTGSEEVHHPQDFALVTPIQPNKHPGPSTGRPGIDYPNFAEIPQTSFDCAHQRYKGFFGDPETNCQVWHYCDLNGGKASFLCPNGTIFSQIALTCDWWFNVKCSTTAQLYVLNERLYKYILPFNPKFPEDYSGPLVDKYLAMKFQEMEEKMRLEKEKLAKNMKSAEQPDEAVEIESSTTVRIQKQETINSQVGEQSSERNLLIDDEDSDISQRGSYDTYESSTESTNSNTREAELPLSLKPIVVSSTPEPDYESSMSLEQQPTDVDVGSKPQMNAKILTYIASTENMLPQKEQIDGLDPAKVSVEKVEVIEIKSDGTSGHITPDILFNNSLKK